MAKKTGYLAALINTPPLIFRFQFNPEILSEKKSYKYQEAPFGNWAFDNTASGAGLIGTLTGLYTDLKEIGSALSNTKPLQAQEGEPRVFAVDFNLDASRPGDLDGDDHYGGSIAPDLALLRSFMMPSMDLIDTAKFIASGFRTPPCRADPPECSFVYGDLSLTCVMTDLNIKITAFEDDGSPRRADVSITLKEQTFSVSPLIEFVKRNIDIGKSYGRAGFGQDLLEVTGLATLKGS
jgi:Contractile injection system tube protein